MKILTAGLILKEVDIGEADKLVNVLTKDKGLITAISPNSRRIRNKNSGILQPLYYCSIAFFKGQKGYIVDEVEIKEKFEELRSDIEKFSLAEYFCEIALVLSPREGESGDFLRLILNCLHFLAKGSMDASVVKAILELRACSLAGYMPNLIGCSMCANYKCEKFYFDIENSLLICQKCMNGKNINSNLVLISEGVLYAMRHIIYSKFDKLFFFNISDSAANLLSSVCEKYILQHVDYKFKSLNFFKSLSNYASEVGKSHE